MNDYEKYEEDFTELITTIKEDMPEWLETLSRYDDLANKSKGINQKSQSPDFSH